jgi:hypothetical protein
MKTKRSPGLTAAARRAAAVLDKYRAVVYTHARLRDYLRDPRTLYWLRHDLAEVVVNTVSRLLP